MNDLRFAVRTLSATPIVSGVSVLSLALGIGATTAIFSLANSLLLRRLPVRDPRALVLVTDATVPGVRAYALGVWESVRRHVDVFDGMLAWSSTDFNLVPRGEAQIAQGAWVSGSYFETLGVSPLLGRMLTESDDRPNGGADGPAAVISHVFWRSRYGAAANVVGRTIVLDGVSFTIVGVMPPRFSGLDVGRTADVIVPFGMATSMRGGAALQVTIMARLRRGQTNEAATAALRRVQPLIRESSLPRGSRWRQQDLDAYLRDGFLLVPGATGNSRLRLRYERPLAWLMVVVTIVLLIASANIANLLLARATDRRREFQVRAALGATRWRLTRAMSAESLVINCTGAVLGAAIASLGSRIVVQQLSTQLNSIQLDVSIDSAVALFALAVTGIVTLLCGIVPAIRGTGTLRPVVGGHEVNDAGRVFGPSGALIVTQVALSLVLVVAAVLFLKTFSSLTAVPLGFEPERVLMAGVSTDEARVPPSQRPETFQRVRAAIRSVPGVADAALSFLTPVSGPILLRPIEVAGGASPERDRLSSVNLVSAGWFRTLGTPIVSGREFTDADRVGAPAVVVVNQTFAGKFLNAENPLGQIVRIGIVGPNAGSAEVVGIAADAVYSSLRDPPPPTIYFPLAQLQHVPPALTLTVRSETESPLQMTRSVAAAIATIDPDASLSFRSLTEQINASVAQERILALLSGFFGGVAVLLAALGLFGVTSYAVSQRRREIGIRMALGAAPGSVVRLVLGRVCLMIGVGVGAGAVVSVWTTPFTASLLFGLEPRDPGTFARAAVVLIGAGLLAALPPALRATHVDPAVVLRSE
jgi:putative ABC transport system permease protein